MGYGGYHDYESLCTPARPFSAIRYLWLTVLRFSAFLCSPLIQSIHLKCGLPLLVLPFSWCTYFLTFFSPFATVSLCGVAGIADNFPSFPVSGPLLYDVPGFQVPPDSIFPPQIRSSSRALPLHLHFDNSSDVFGFISSFDEPVLILITNAIGSHNQRYRFHICNALYAIIFRIRLLYFHQPNLAHVILGSTRLPTTVLHARLVSTCPF